MWLLSGCRLDGQHCGISQLWGSGASLVLLISCASEYHFTTVLLLPALPLLTRNDSYFCLVTGSRELSPFLTHFPSAMAIIFFASSAGPESAAKCPTRTFLLYGRDLTAFSGLTLLPTEIMKAAVSKTQAVSPKWTPCWATISDVDPLWDQLPVSVSCSLGAHITCFSLCWFHFIVDDCHIELEDLSDVGHAWYDT